MSVVSWIRRLRASGRPAHEVAADEAPLPFLLFNLDQLEAHARHTAGLWQMDRRRGPDRLLPRLAENQRRLHAVSKQLGAAHEARVTVSPAGEWLLDNQHVIEEQIHLARHHLPRGYSQGLPHLIDGPSAGLPRVYLMALEVIEHVDGRIDEENLSRFLSAWQQTSPLTLGELWAIPIMLRLALIEHLRRVSSRVSLGMLHRELAREWSQRIITAAEQDPKTLLLAVADMARADPPLSNAFVAELVQRLQEQDGLADIPLSWIEHQLAERGSSLPRRVQAESGDQAANQVSVSSAIGSLRSLGRMVWRDFVEDHSHVEATLRRDPGMVYAQMDFATRDRYRHVVEDLAREADLDEVIVAERAVTLAEAGARAVALEEAVARAEAPQPGQGELPPTDPRRAHVGYYLIDEGVPALLDTLPTLPTHRRLRRRWRHAAWSGGYFGVILGGTVGVTAAVMANLPPLGGLETLGVGLLVLTTASQVGTLAANWLATTWHPPTLLPRLDVTKGVPDHCRTLVIVPTLLTRLDQVDVLLDGLEVRYLGNQDPNLLFGLLTDFADAPTETLPDDAALLERLGEGLQALNLRYGPSDRFFVFHRARTWNAHERVWMGYERKRGKLEALNLLLRGLDRRPGAREPSFARILGDPQALLGIAFVLTLDTDTRLPRDAGQKLIGTLAHPLNRPIYDPVAQRIRQGYALLQPRVAIHLPSTRRSWFVRLYAGEAGTDPYTLAVSDVYQDLFGEGSFVGKGIYDVDAFTRALQTQLPDNLILSHDLIEGCFARSGLVSDVLLYEDHPSHFLDDGARRRRWTRGDWQILYWLLPWAPDRGGAWQKNPLTLLSRWKIVDNLRRSLVPLATLTLIAAGMVLLPDTGWLVVALLSWVFGPAIAASLGAILRLPPDIGLGPHLRFEGHAAIVRMVHAAIGLVFLPEDGRNSLDAIVRSAVRMFVTHRNLLEWRSGNAERLDGARWFVQAMGTGPLLSLGIVLLRSLQGYDLLNPMLWVLVPWTLAPLLAAWLSADRDEAPPRLPAADEADLRRIARGTWRFFETFVGPDDHWLPPDNYQERPEPVVAHRTSPTNIGLSLLSNLAAHDFGYVSAATLLRRTRGTLDTIGKLERFRNHLYNWYDTRTLQAMPPLYVSTVDSGNLMGHLLVLETGLRELGDAPIVSPKVWQGIGDTLDLLVSAAPGLADTLAEIRQSLRQPPETLGAAWSQARELEIALARCQGETLHLAEDARGWTDALTRQVHDAMLTPLAELAGWVPLLPGDSSEIPEGFRAEDPIPNLRWLAQREGGLRAQTNLSLPAERVGDEEGGPAPEEVAVGDLGVAGSDTAAWRTVAQAAAARAVVLLDEAEALAHDAAGFAEMDLEFLYDSARGLFTIGYNVPDRRKDGGHYDLLASEARLLSFLAVATGAVPQAHWFALGRLVTTWRNGAALLSWSGSMFEYLMPALVMPSFPGTLLDQTSRAVVGRQVEYGAQLGTPWGVSESGYNLVDASLNYQYKAFGVPGLGLQRGLGEDQVIAPYATVLALMVAPAAAYANLVRMRELGFEGHFGFYEAVDYTARRQGVSETHTVVRSYMAHHQGMSLLALASILLDQPMQRRFRRRPALRATELLLHERVPKQAALYPHEREAAPSAVGEGASPPALFVLNTADTPRPEVHLLSNGRYSVMITNAGGGYSRWNELQLTRWREDPTADDWGSYCYVRDVDDDHRWSTTHQPTGVMADHYEAIFPQSRAEFRRRDHGIELHTEIGVSPEDDVELRRITLTNLSPRTRVIELTSFSEVVLAPAAADEAHPAFSNLFVQTEVIPARQVILCTRRPRAEGEAHPVLFHLLTPCGPSTGASFRAPEGSFEFETDRRTFIGRGRSSADPAGTMTGSEGSVLDPIVAIRCRIRLDPEQSVSVHLVTGVAPTRDEALVLVDKYHDRHMADRVFELGWTHRQVVLRQLGIAEAEAELYLRMVSAIVYVNPLHRAPAGTLARNRRGQSSLWAYGISGDLPIVLIRVATLDTMTLVRQVVRAHTWWRGLGLAVDLVVWDETEGGYQNTVRDQVLSGMSTGTGTALFDVPGGVFVRRVEQFADEDRVLLQSVARLLLTGGGGTLAAQLQPRPRPLPPMPHLVPRSPWMDGVHSRVEPARSPPPEEGLVDGGQVYQIVTSSTRRTPAPWSNILSNPHFGTLVTESGGGYTWCENAHEFRLTPWSNDPVTDRCGEAFYLRDEESGVFWSPTPLPAPGAGIYITRHQPGSTSFQHSNEEISSELTMFVAIDAPVKIVLLRLTNTSGRTRHLSATGYCEWVLGEHRSRSLMHVSTEVDAASEALLARNPYHAEFGARIAFFDVSERRRSVTGDRTEFLGRNGRLACPAALERERLSGRVGAGLDACAAMMVPIELRPGASHELCFVFGVGRNIHDIRTLLSRFGRVPEARQAWMAVRRHWTATLGALTIETPHPGLDVLVNQWLPYQVIACRLWARTGFFQSGGAFGFRDQLQDTMALLYVRPTLLREQIVRCAGRQFEDGDVQHWWHPPSGRGVRTHCSDDLLWLPLAISRYVIGTGDTGVLAVRAPYLAGRQVKPDEEAYGDLPHPTEASGTVYEHAVRAIRRALRFGAHGLPLMGSGDWNDGMNLVGARGRGESVWLGFFLFEVLRQFGPVARLHGDPELAALCEREGARLAEQVETQAWDGAWYRRAWFDSGEVLGSAENNECQLDALPQSWAVFTGLGDPARARAAMEAVDERLVDRDAGVIKLLAPPFDTGVPNAGYIQGYVPGVRENGGQYTHAALWTAMAFAQLGDWRRAWELTLMLDPGSHTRTAAAREQYRVEPYVMAADVYAVAPHAGMGGWTWHTGSAGWMIRLVVESLLGFRLDVDRLTLSPCVPPDWSGFTIRIRFRQTRYRVVARPVRAGEVAGFRLDGVEVPSPLILTDDRADHEVEARYPAPTSGSGDTAQGDTA